MADYWPGVYKYQFCNNWEEELCVSELHSGLAWCMYYDFGFMHKRNIQLKVPINRKICRNCWDGKAVIERSACKNTKPLKDAKI